MTTLFLDGFDHYGSGAPSRTNMLAGPYAVLANGVSCQAPGWGAARTGALCFCNGGNESGWSRRVLPTPGTHFFVRFGFAVDSLQPLSNGIIAFMDGSANVLFALYWTSTGALELAAGNGTVIATTSGPVIVSENWHFMEMEVNTGGGVNTFTLRVDDAQAANTPVLTATSATYIAGTIAQIGLLTGNLGAPVPPNSYLDDLFVNDNNGTVNNGWLGDRRVATLLADADTANKNWTPRYYEEIGAGILNLTAANSCVSAATSTSLNLGSGDFTIESFVRFQSLPTASNPAVIFGKWDVTANQRSYQLFLGSVALNGGSLCFQTSTDGTVATVQQPIVYPFTPELDAWYHIALVRASGELLLFVNGQQLGLPIADSRTYFAGAAPMGLGGQVETASGVIANTTVDGWFDETRLTVGFARYTANFTPPAVALPRGAGNDPQWADVAFLAGYDSLGVIQDESSFNRALTAKNGAVQQPVFDGPAVGAWSTLGKAVPDDNTFLEAPFLPATDILTLSAQPAVNDTVTVGGTTYTFVSALTAADQVLIDTSLQQTLQNLYNAINAGPGSGAKYGAGTTANTSVSASQLPAGQMQVTALTAGSAGNAITASVSLHNGGGWATPTLTGGTNIPGPSDFSVQRPPPLTTIISAVQITQRAFKSDAGLCSVQSALVGPLGTVVSANAHPLTVSPSYYGDIYESDPDTGVAITPATIINGRIRLNRTV